MKPFAAALLLAVASAALAQAPRTTQVDAKARASAHYDRGVALYKEARYREAIAEFQAAQVLAPKDTKADQRAAGIIHFNLGQCYEKLGDLPAAIQSYRDYLRAVPDAEDRLQVERVIANLEARLGATGVQQLRVYSSPSGAEVIVDGQSRGRTPLALQLPLGGHTVSLVKAGYLTTRREVALISQVSTEMDVMLVPPPPPPPPPPKPRPLKWEKWATAGAAAVVLGLGVYYGVQARNAQDDLRGTLHDSATAAQLARDAKAKARTANIMYGVGGAAAIGAGALFYFEGTF